MYPSKGKALRMIIQAMLLAHYKSEVEPIKHSDTSTFQQFKLDSCKCPHFS